EAIEKKLQGKVVVEAAVDAKGIVTAVRVTKSVSPTLDKAAIDGVKAHVFEAVLEGAINPGPLVVGVGFTLPAESKNTGGVVGGVVGGVLGGQKAEVELGDVVRITGEGKPPRLVREVAPAYPAAAREAMVEGVIILEAMIDTRGRVVNVKVLRSIPLLDQAAVDAVRQWIYEPFIFKGKPHPAIFTVTVRFTLKDSE
ncbi:MAG: energy transducer TonB, partial [Acidobacteriota bacterium]|nr:energy transducer TonB [Acidobacteriota bacterium]